MNCTKCLQEAEMLPPYLIHAVTQKGTSKNSSSSSALIIVVTIQTYPLILPFIIYSMQVSCSHLYFFHHLLF